MHGYVGSYLKIDLSASASETVGLDAAMARDYLGASGLAARLYLDLMAGPSYPDALDPGNPLIIFTGPVAGHQLPGSSRVAVCARSPLSGFWGESSAGGYFAPALKAAGCDGLVVNGAADHPVYLLITNGRVEIKDAGDLWGMDTYETDAELKRRHGARARTLSIGPAGERLVRFAAVVHDKGHVAGRTGMGAVMGSKRLKAVVALGDRRVTAADPAAIAAVRQAVLERQAESLPAQTFHAFGTAGSVYVGSLMGDVPFKNWLAGEWSDEALQAIDGTTMESTILTGTPTCHSCSIACKRQVAVIDGPYQVPEGPGPEYETVVSFGSLLLCDDLKALAKANELCNRYGLDTISCGATIAFAIEATERGLLQSDLAWGHSDAVLRLIADIALRRGLGDLLAEGSRRAAEQLSGAPADMCLTVKSLEVSMHSPRAYHGLGIGYATAPRGACHNAAHVYLFLGSVFYPQLGLEGPFDERSSDGKAEASARGQDYACVLNAASFCMLNNMNYSVTQVVDALNAVTGFGYSVDDLIALGERLWQLKHGINNLLGATAADDRLPDRLMQPLADGPAAGSAPDMALMLPEFYRFRRLDADGSPSGERLRALGLVELAQRLSAR